MLDIEDSGVDGNSACRQLLQYWSGEVLKGKISHIAIIACWSPTTVATGTAGAGGLEFALNYGCDLLKDTLMQRQRNMAAPAVTAEGADHVVYNLSRMPSSFDFLAWLIKQEMTRVKNGAPFPLKVKWYYGKDGSRISCLNTEQRAINFDGILRQCLTLIGAVESNLEISGHSEEDVGLLPVVNAYKDGQKLPELIVPTDLKNEIHEAILERVGQMPVTITLREVEDKIEFAPHRNSNLTEWIKLAEWLEKRGERVVFVRDTRFAAEPITGFETCPPASTGILARTALYQVAKANLFVSNGPAMIAVFGNKPWLIFNELQPGGNYWANTPDGWRNCAGIEFAGDQERGQWPWSKPDQRIVWQRDNFETMRDAWLQYIEPSLKAAA